MNNYNSKSYIMQWLVIVGLITVLASILTGVITAILVYFFHHPFTSLRHHLWVLFAISFAVSILYFYYETRKISKNSLFDKLPARQGPPIVGPIDYFGISRAINNAPIDYEILCWLFGVIGTAIAVTYHFLKIHLGF